jgi:adenine phosphoribosyltransferase
VGDWRDLIRDVADFPVPGVVFKDISPVLAHAMAFAAMIDELIEACRAFEPEAVVAIEARGFLLAAPVALALGTGLAPVRKPGKLPFRTRSVAYSLEYGDAVLHMHSDALATGSRVLIVDDVLATGGTIDAAVQLIRASDAEPIGAAVLMDIAALGGVARLGELPVRSLTTS